MSTLEIKSLNGLRGIAAYLVVLSHFVGANKLADGHLQTGKIGVMIFFALSGFLMAHLYMNSGIKKEAASLYQYAVRRIARVLPLYFLLVFLSFAIGFFEPRVLFRISESNIWNHIFLQEGVSVLWTISVEFAFYFLFGIFLIFWNKHAAWVIGFILVVLVVNALVGYPGNVPEKGQTGRDFWFGYNGFFFVGMLAAFAHQQFEQTRSLELMSDLGFILCIFGVFLLVPATYSVFFPIEENWEQNEVYLAFAGLLMFVCARSKIADYVLGNRPMAYLGAISFAVYLIHIPVLRFLRIFTDIDLDVTLYAIVFVLVTTVISAVVHYYFERPSMIFINRIFGARDNEQKLRTQAAK